jgi:hypothetical protein
MRSRVKPVLAAVVMLLGVAACTPDGYVVSPVLGTYFKSLVSAANNESVRAVSVCSYNDTWYTTVLFSDGLLYHYSVNPDDSSLKLESQSTPAQRDHSMDSIGNDGLECIGGYRDTWLPWHSFKEGGSYRFEFRGSSVEGEVRKAIVIRDSFDDVIKKRLQSAAQATRMAVSLHQQFVPAEKSWGVTP